MSIIDTMFTTPTTCLPLPGLEQGLHTQPCTIHECGLDARTVAAAHDKDGDRHRGTPLHNVRLGKGASGANVLRGAPTEPRKASAARLGMQHDTRSSVQRARARTHIAHAGMTFLPLLTESQWFWV